MRNMFSLAILAAGIGAYAVSAAETKIELNGKNTEIKFVGSKPDGKHEGGFKTLTGAVTADGSDMAKTKIEVEIEMDSVYSDDAKLTGHLKSPDFFGVKANPKSKFVSTKVEPTTAGCSITGDLTLNGKTKSITFPAKTTTTAAGMTLKSEFKINRNDFGITYGAGKISDDVELKLAIDAKK